MKLTIDGEMRKLIPAAEFREAHGLPEAFTLGRFVTADAPYNRFWFNENNQFDGLEEQLLRVVPSYIDLSNLTEVPQIVANVFEQQLVNLGIDMELTRDEVEITATDFRNVLEPAVYKLVELNYLNQGDKAVVQAQFDIDTIYQEVIDSTVFVNGQAHTYQHGEEMWEIHTVHTAFGPLAMRVETAAGDIYYIEDRTVAFPAIDLIHELSVALGQSICDVFTRE